MSLPRVSIGLPVYNGERYLAACLESLLGQAYGNLELIISDNGSTDATPAICGRYGIRDHRVRYVRHERNRGGAWNHNYVLSLATGEYFKWCGADDLCHPWFLRACVAALEADRDAVLAYPQSVVIDDAGRATERTATRLPLDAPDVVTRFTSVMSALCLTQNVFYGLYRRAALLRAAPLGSFPAADRCLVGRMALLGRFAVLPDYLMYRRRHTGNQRSLAAEQRFYRPAVAARFHPREWRVLREHIANVMRARLPAATRLRLLRAIGRWVVRQRGDLASEGRELVAEALRL